THHEKLNCFDYMRSLIENDNDGSEDRRKRAKKPGREISSLLSNNKNVAKRKGKQDEDQHQLDAHTIQWKLSNTNPCPNCCILIHRDDGCNKVDCMLCGYRFCWICREAWGVACGFFRCGRRIS